MGPANNGHAHNGYEIEEEKNASSIKKYTGVEDNS
jgi:hypothetical protein